MSRNASEKVLVVGFGYFRKGFEQIFGGRSGFAYCEKERHWDKWSLWQRARFARRFRIIHFFWARITLAEFLWLKLWNPTLRIILHFIGSDVTLVVAKKRRVWEYRFYQLCGVAFYADHIHLIEELAIQKIEARLLVLVNSDIKARSLPLPEKFSVLAYVPQGKEDFYHLDWIISAAEALPEVSFTIWRNDRKFEQSNIRIRGHISDVFAEMALHSVFVRLTEHDGLPCTLVEALSCGRQVIWSFAHPYCYRVNSADELIAVLKHLQHQAKFNAEGQAYVVQRYNVDRVREDFFHVWGIEGAHQ